MLSDFLTVAEQVAVLFILIAGGYIAAKTGFLNEVGAKTLTNIALFFATPCVIIKSFVREFNPEALNGFLMSILISFIIHAASAAAVWFIFRGKDDKTVCVQRFGAVFSNAGYMALPLQAAVLGENGVFLGASYVAVFNLFVWTYGVFCMTGDKKTLSVKKIILNPCILSVAIGAAIFLFSIDLPEIILAPISHFAALNTPVPMLIIGYYLANVKIKDLFREYKAYPVILARLVLIPLAALAVMVLFSVKGDMLVAMTIAGSAPVAAATTMFAVMFDKNVRLSVNLTSLSTVFSMLTMPLIVSLAQHFA